MREIKFRAWDGEQMLSDWLVLKDTGCGVFPTNLSRKAEKVMQFTGLHDKNGKEIYEGDIVRADEQIMRVVWFSLGACFRYAPDDENLESILNYDDVEVIGNIYENSNLLV